MAVPDNRDVLQQRWEQAAGYYTSGDWDAAIAAYTAMLELAPDFVPAYVERGLILREQGDDKRALQDFERAIALDPSYGLAYYGRGWVRHARGD